MLFLFTSYIYSQNISDGEFMIVNHMEVSEVYIKAVIYPVGAIFSGGGQYTVDSRYRITDQNKYIYGKEIILDYHQTGNWYEVANFDATSEKQDCTYSLGYGLYRIDFYYNPNGNSFILADSCYVDFSDANFGTSSFIGYQKLRIDYYPDGIKFSFIGANATEHRISEVDKNMGTIWNT